MKNADDSKPTRDILPDESDLGPEPDWLLDDDVTESVAEPTPPDPEPTVEIRETAEPLPVPAIAEQRPASTAKEPMPPGQTRSHPWLWGTVPLVILLATGIIAWFGTTQTLNDLATWEAIRAQSPPLLPARWAMMIWWLVLPLMAVFLIYGTLPAGREVTRIKVTGPLISIALIATNVWLFAQHWRWELIGIASMGIAAVAVLGSYLMVALGPHITRIRQRMVAVTPLSAALAFSIMLTVLAWQSYSTQPFGERGTSVLFALLLVMAAAVFAFFLRDGLFSLVLAIWFAGVVYQQWGEDAVISLVAGIALLFTAALTGLGTILATESHRPSLTTSVDTRRGRISFFRKKGNPSPEELP